MATKVKNRFQLFEQFLKSFTQGTPLPSFIRIGPMVQEEKMSKEIVERRQTTMTLNNGLCAQYFSHIVMAGAPNHGFLVFLTPVLQHPLRAPSCSSHVGLRLSTQCWEANVGENIRTWVPKVKSPTRYYCAMVAAAFGKELSFTPLYSQSSSASIVLASLPEIWLILKGNTIKTSSANDEKGSFP